MKEKLGLQILWLIATGLMGGDALAEGHHQSGVSGEVVIYICPVVRPGIECYRPFQTGITVLSDKGRSVTEFITDEQGHFEIFLKPGNYVLVPDAASEGGFPLVKPVTVHVDKKQFSSVRIVYDSGIR